MTRFARRALAVLSALVLVLPALAGAAQVTILHVNDTHSHLEAIGPKDSQLRGTLGGLTKAATVIAGMKAVHPDALFVHAGDLFNGDAYFAAGIGPGGTPALSVPELTLLNQLQLDVLTLGNHELGLGTSVLAPVLAATQQARRAVLSANLDLTAAGLSGLVTPNTIKVVDGVRVGFFGMTVRDFVAMAGGAPFLGYTTDALRAIAQQQVNDLRVNQHADVVVLLSHLGFEADQDLAAHVDGIDAVVGGHDHLVLAQPRFVQAPDGRDVPIVQAGSFYRWVGKLTLTVEGGQVTGTSYALVSVDGLVPRLPAMATAVQQLQQTIDQRYDEDLWGSRLATALADVAKDAPKRSPLRDSPVGDLIADALRAKGGTDLGLTVDGFLPEGLTRGPLVRDDAFRIVGDGIDPTGAGLGFQLYEIRLTGLNLAIALESALAAGSDFFPEVSGMSFVYDSRRPAGGRLVAVLVGGRPLELAREYGATVDYGLLQGLAFFPDVEFRVARTLDGSEYAAVRDWLAHLRAVLYFSHGRSIDLGFDR